MYILNVCDIQIDLMTQIDTQLKEEEAKKRTLSPYEVFIPLFVYMSLSLSLSGYIHHRLAYITCRVLHVYIYMRVLKGVSL